VVEQIVTWKNASRGKLYPLVDSFQPPSGERRTLVSNLLGENACERAMQDQLTLLIL